MRITLAITFLFLNSIKAISQHDSLKDIVHQHSQITQVLNNESTDLKNKGVSEIITFVTMGTHADYGTIIWKERNILKGANYIYKYRNQKVKTKKIKSAELKNPSLDSLFYFNCDINNAIRKNEKIYLSHDLVLLFQKDIRGIKEEVIFNVSNYSG